MINPKARMVSILLTIGIFFTLSCTLLERTSSSSASADDAEDRLEVINTNLQSNPNNIDLQIEKAQVLVEIASGYQNPAERKVYYSNLRELVSTQRSVSGEVHPEINNITTKAWNTEQGQGVRLLQQNRSNLEETNTDYIIGHFENAITINPDSISTYNLLANTYYRTGRFNDAITTLEKADEIAGDRNNEIKEKLAYLYLESGDIEKSIEIYRELAGQTSDNPQILNGLANAYILNQQHTEAIDILRELTDQYPTRYEYKEVLATQLYFVVSIRLDEAATGNWAESASDSEKDFLFSLIEEIDSIFETLQSNLPFSEDQLVSSGAFYKNTADKLKNLSLTAEESFANEVELLRTDLLEKALPIWEKLFETHPENIGYVKNLYEIYLELGKVEEAESLERTFNL